MWLTISGVAAVTGALPYVLWRHRDRVGFIADWTIILVEIGTPAGSVSTGAGSGSAGAIIACSLLGLVIIVAGAALDRVLARRWPSYCGAPANPEPLRRAGADRCQCASTAVTQAA
jgi:hypothetical protein